MNVPNRRWWIYAASAIVVVVLVVLAIDYADQRHKFNIDSRIVEQSKGIIANRLANLVQEDTLFAQCGKFRSWELSEWSRNNWAWRLVSQVSGRGMAHFENADVPLTVAIGGGNRSGSMRAVSVVVARFPQDDWLKEHPESHVELRGRELVMLNGGATPVSLTASVGHPDYIPD